MRPPAPPPPHDSTVVGSSSTASPITAGFMLCTRSSSTFASMSRHLHHRRVHAGTSPIATGSTPRLLHAHLHHHRGPPHSLLICYENIASVVIAIFLCFTYINDNMTSKLRNDIFLRLTRLSILWEVTIRGSWNCRQNHKHLTQLSILWVRTIYLVIWVAYWKNGSAHRVKF
jgi:hypothetical protein